jgi:hypothetical protein
MTIQGRILDSFTGEPLPGANLALVLLSSGFSGGFLEIPTGEGTTTDTEGRYTLEIPSGQQVNISYVGYVTRKLAPNDPALRPLPMVTDIRLELAENTPGTAVVVAARTYHKQIVFALGLVALAVGAWLAFKN